MNVNALDLNLLKVLDALLAERSVSQAAVRLGLSQPATSHALARLRTVLGDPLFVRAGRSLVPTPRARSLAAPIAEALRALGEALAEPRPFEPATTSRTFVIAASDHAQLIVLPGLAARLAPFKGLRLRGMPLPERFPLEALESGAVDLVLGVFDLAPGDRIPKGLRRQVLVQEGFVAVRRKGHAGARRVTSAEEAFALPRFHVAPRGGAGAPLRRGSRHPRYAENIMLSVPHYLVAPWVLTSTELVAALPERVAARFADSFPLRISAIGFPTPKLPVVQVWHPRSHEDAAHRRLRMLVKEEAMASPLPKLGEARRKA